MKEAEKQSGHAILLSRALDQGIDLSNLAAIAKHLNLLSSGLVIVGEKTRYVGKFQIKAGDSITLSAK